MLKSVPLPAPPGIIRWSGERIAPDVLMLLLALLAFLLSGPLLRRIDVTSAPFDPGLLSALAFAAATVLSAGLLARVLTTVLARYATTVMVKPFNFLKPWQHLLLLLGLYGSFFWGFMLVLTALL